MAAVPFLDFPADGQANPVPGLLITHVQHFKQQSVNG
jgi:hypothetical protein